MRQQQTIVCRIPTLLVTLGFVGSSASGAPITLTNADVEGDGKLEIRTDDFGTWLDDEGFSGGTCPCDEGATDLFDFFDPGTDPDDPLNNPGREFASFMAITFLHVNPSLFEGKVAFSNHGCMNPIYNNRNPDDCDSESGRGGPAEFGLSLVQENTSGGLPASTSSIFDVTKDGESIIQVDLSQTVKTAPLGPRDEVSAFIDLTYSLTNLTDETLELMLIRHIDEDMPWVDAGFGGNFALDDFVGVDFAELGYPQVYAQDGDVSTAALVLSTTESPLPVPGHPGIPGTTAFWYYIPKGFSGGGDGLNPIIQPTGLPAGIEEDGPGCYGDPDCSNRNVDPDLLFNDNDGLCPWYGFGSDLYYWERPGVPNCWKNHVPGAVGYDTPGQTPDNIDGDSSMGLQVEFLVNPGDSYTITFRTTYGYRPVPPRFAAPDTTMLLAGTQVDENGIADYLFTIGNDNPGGGQAPDPIDVFYLDIEAGRLGATGAGDRDVFWTLPVGWNASNCTGFDDNGHAVFKIDRPDPNIGGPILFLDSPLKGRVRIRTNDLTENTNTETEVTVPPLSIILTVAQDQPDVPEEDRGWTAVCQAGDYSFGPTQLNGLWSIPKEAPAFLPVPSLAAWGKTTLLATLALCGTLLIRRSQRPATA